ncbi:hypothetical protein Nepgr_023178 [Nepenthes gracilis]|uniref:Uncharacterized protein n=1 Tax=Nepenthes gracilis TaxID=150966 RepID=A0AAD3T3U5_NEPGR|nr:hypothetical protein Nepgr_023178 [Nepenthes gracilis]
MNATCSHYEQEEEAEEDGEVFLDESDGIQEIPIDEEELPDAEDGLVSDVDDIVGGPDDSIHIFTGHSGRVMVPGGSPFDFLGGFIFIHKEGMIDGTVPFTILSAPLFQSPIKFRQNVVIVLDFYVLGSIVSYLKYPSRALDILARVQHLSPNQLSVLGKLW